MALFTRLDRPWYKSDRAFIRIFNVITRPSRAFWDINHKRKDFGPFWILLINSILLAFSMMAVYWHARPQAFNGVVTNIYTFYFRLIQTGPIFLTFMMFGIIYYSVLFAAFNGIFSLVANISVQLDDILELRFQILRKRGKIMDFLSGKNLRKDVVLQHQHINVETLKKKEDGGMTRLAQTGKFRMMKYAYAPLIAVNIATFVILLVLLPRVNIIDTNAYNSENALNIALATIYNSPMWGIIDVINILAMIVWIPATLAIAMRDLANTNTTKLLIGNIIIGIPLSYILYFLRPSLGWNFDIIARFG